jgi:two-component system KDP operon response regulator KdpE
MEEKILVIDDEKPIQRLLKITLESAGYRIHESYSGESGVIAAASFKPDIILLDLGLPDIDGLVVLKKIREWSKAPVIILSVRNSEKDIIAALDNGADDYITKPFSTGELLARIRVASRHRDSPEYVTNYKSNGLTVDITSRVVKKDGEIVKLTATEYSLLLLFIKNAGKVLTHSYILKEVWGLPFSEENQYVRIFIAQLRKKLEDDPNEPKLFVTESGVGYRFVMK